MVSIIQDAPFEAPVVNASAPRLKDEAFSRLVLREGVPSLGLPLDELLRRVRPEQAAA